MTDVVHQSVLRNGGVAVKVHMKSIISENNRICLRGGAEGGDVSARLHVRV